MSYFYVKRKMNSLEVKSDYELNYKMNFYASRAKTS